VPAAPVTPPNSRRGSAPGASNGSWPHRTSIAALRPIAVPGPAPVCTGTSPAHPGRRPDQSIRHGRTTGATDTGLLGTRSDGYLIVDLYHSARTHLSLAKDPPEPRRVEPLTKARSSRRQWPAASIIATVGERRKLLSAGCSDYIDGAGRCVRLGALERTPRWLRAESRWSTLGVHRIRRP
jgi:hypothetical protein